MFRRLLSLAPFLAAMVMIPAGCGGDNPTQPGNHAPVADAGIDRVIAVGGTALLVGGGDDEDPGDALTYAWTLVARPEGSNAVIVDSGRNTASFAADSVGIYVVRLTVSDGKATGSDDATITARQVAAHRPAVPYAG